MAAAPPPPKLGKLGSFRPPKTAIGTWPLLLLAPILLPLKLLLLPLVLPVGCGTEREATRDCICTTARAFKVGYYHCRWIGEGDRVCCCSEAQDSSLEQDSLYRR